MDRGGPDGIAPLRRPLVDDSPGGRSGSIPQRQPPPGVGAGASSSSSSRQAPGAFRGGPREAAIKRGPSTPSRPTNDARESFQRSLRCDGKITAVCVAGVLDLDRLSESLGGASKSAAAGGAELVQRFMSGDNLVLHLKINGDKDIFLFRFGCMVCWGGFTRDPLEEARKLLKPFLQRPLTSDHVEEENMEYVDEQHRPGDVQDIDDEENYLSEPEHREAVTIPVKSDQIILTTKDPLERLAHSYAMAQSVRLNVFENAVERSIAHTRSIPETMAETGEVNIDTRELSKQMGGLLVLRCDVNLHTDILDTPEIFWDEERFEPHYVACRGYLDVDKRVEILNQRLGILKDLYDLLQNGLNVKHGNKLEWIIIILILVEVVLELLELMHDAWVGTSASS